MAIQTNTKVTLSTKEAAEYLGISYWTLLQNIREKKIPFIAIGNRYLFRKESLDNWLSQQEQNSIEEEEEEEGGLN